MNTVKCESAEKNLTGNAGLIHIGKFIDKPDLSEILKKHISIERASNATYQVADAVIMLTLGIIAGVRHMSHMALLRTDAVIRPIFGWKDFPDDSTLGRIFKLFSHSSRNELSEVGNEVRRKVWKKRWFGRVTPDSDSSVRGVYGFQEGAAVGYNPGKHGQRSYHPLFCLIAETCGCLRNWFRTGDAYSANGIVRFAGECVARLPKGVWKIFVRADSAFSDGAFPDFLGSRGASYLIRARMGNLQTVLSGQTWRRVRNMPGYESAEFSYRCAERTKPGRFVGVRKLIGVMTEGVLFPEHIYDYFCYVTNDSLTPWQAHKKYGKRAASENRIGWCKNQMAAGSILTQNLWANPAIFQTCILAYNLMAWMMWPNQGRKISEEPDTIRFRLIHVPGRLLTSGRQLVLRLSENWFSENRWTNLGNSIDIPNLI